MVGAQNLSRHLRSFGVRFILPRHTEVLWYRCSFSGRSLHCSGCSEAVGETPVRCKAHPNPESFLFHMLGALFNLVVTPRNTDYWVPLNGLHQVPIWGRPACKNLSTESRNEAYMTEIHQVLHGITGRGSPGLCVYEQSKTDPKM